VPTVRFFVPFPMVSDVVELVRYLSPAAESVEPDILKLVPNEIQTGALVPPDPSNWLVVPALENAYAEPVPYASAPAVGVADAFVPPPEIGIFPLTGAM
jgi:hypothetical protein